LIINYREQNKLQTIITSNFTLDEIDMYIDRRISSRIAGMCEVVRMSGDKRLKQR
jgi:DNA replication protein DnaC